MPRDIDKRIKHANARDGGKQKEQRVMLNDFYFCYKIFPCKGCNDDRCGEPTIKSECNWLYCFDHTSCYDEIARPDQCGDNGKKDPNKNLALVMV